MNDEELFPSLERHGAIAVDCETCDPDLEARGPGYHRGGFIAGVAVATEAGFKGYYPVAHEPGDNLDSKKVFSWLKRELAREEQPKVGARLLYDYSFLDHVGVKMAGPLYDVQVAEPLLNENKFVYSLESIAQEYLGEGKVETELLDYLKKTFGRKKRGELKSDIWRAPVSLVTPYALADVDLPLRVLPLQRAKLEKQDLWDLFLMESKLIPLLAAMHKRGVAIDIPRTEEAVQRMRKSQTELQADLNRMAGSEIAVWAADSIKVAFDQMGLAYPLTAKTKKPSFTRAFLEHHDHPMTKRILEVRKMDKLAGTFLEGYLLNGQHNGRVHCQFNQLKSEEGGTVTGRFSSSLPNLQNIPIRTDEGKFIRTCFIADKGSDWGKSDYSQIEYRLIVHDAASLNLTGADTVVQAYHERPGETDFHTEVAVMMGYDRKDKEGRARAKTINFGLAYGEGVAKLCNDLGMTIEEGTKFINGYHQAAPFIKKLSDRMMQQAASKGEIITLLGRRRRFDTWEKKNWTTGETTYIKHRAPGFRRAFTHAGLNSRSQGSASDIIKKAMVDIADSGVITYLGAPLLTVHDELDWDVPKNKAARQAFKETQRIMENVVKLLVPLRVDGGRGPNWGDVKETA